MKSCRQPPWRASSAAAKNPCAGYADLCSPLSVHDYLLTQQSFVLVCLLESGIIRALTLLATSGNKVRHGHRIVGHLVSGGSPRPVWCPDVCVFVDARCMDSD